MSNIIAFISRIFYLMRRKGTFWGCFLGCWTFLGSSFSLMGLFGAHSHLPSPPPTWEWNCHVEEQTWNSSNSEKYPTLLC